MEGICVIFSLQGGVYEFKGDYPWSGYKETDRGVNVELNVSFM